MDLFFESLPFPEKRRRHFHRFMHDVHTELKGLQNREAPLDSVADGIAADTRVLCFDELFVSDIADAVSAEATVVTEVLSFFTVLLSADEPVLLPEQACKRLMAITGTKSKMVFFISVLICINYNSVKVTRCSIGAYSGNVFKHYRGARYNRIHYRMHLA